MAPDDGTVAPPADEREMRLRYAGTCCRCGAELPPGSRGVYQRSTRSVRCAACPAPTTPVEPAVEVPVERGTAGASARREYDRRTAKRESGIRAAHPRVGGFILAVTEEPQSTRAWARGAGGEEKVGHRLDAMVTPTVRVMHDRRISRTRANIDHLVVYPSGVLVIDAKRYTGRPTRRVEGGFFLPRVEKLVVGRRDGTHLVEGVLKQVALVRSALDGAPGADVDDVEPVNVVGVLCFVDADWPLFGGSFTVGGVHVLWPKKVIELAGRPGPLSKGSVSEVELLLARTFPAA